MERTIAQNRTWIVLRQLDHIREGDVVRFLHGANLITKSESIIDLRGTHLDRADLRRADLQNANLQGAWMANAELSQAQLNNTNLSSIHLSPTVVSKRERRGFDAESGKSEPKLGESVAKPTMQHDTRLKEA